MKDFLPIHRRGLVPPDGERGDQVSVAKTAKDSLKSPVASTEQNKAFEATLDQVLTVIIKKADATKTEE